MHEGHRGRLRKRFLEEGLDGFQMHQILELLLFYAVPRKDTNKLAHKLINRYGSLSGVFEADYADLIKGAGLSENTAVLLTLIPPLARVYMKDRWGDRPVLNNTEKAGKYVVSLFAGRCYEVFYVICLDSQNRVIHASVAHEGTINEAPVYPRIIVEIALRHHASSIILAHNHPGGSLKPSMADIDVTRRIAEALKTISVNVLDHIIAAGDNYISLREKGLFDKGMS